MAVPHSVRLRPLTRTEQRVLRDKLRDLSLSARIHQRYRVIAEVGAGRSVSDAAERAGCHFTRAYAWVHRFNESGFASFEAVSNPRGRPPILKTSQLRELTAVALSSPAERGLPFSVWSVAKLTEYCRAKKLLPDITDEWVRRLLRREGISAQRIRTWKTSDDPAFDRKKTNRGPYPALPQRRGGRLLRRVGPARAEAARRDRLDSRRQGPDDARDVQPQAGRRVPARLP